MKMFINGTMTNASDGRSIQIFNSATHQPIDTVPFASREDVERAISAAQEGKRLWRKTPVSERSRILCDAAGRIDALREELTVSLSEETGKVRREARGEIRVCAQILRGFAEAANHLYGQTMTDYQVGTEKDIIFTRHEPIGVIACISPFNYPVELCFQKVGAALAAGNAVIVKPATDNPLTIMKIVGILWDAGVPGNVLQLVTGSGAEIGTILSESPLINAISLTGSTAVGIDVASRSASTLKRVFAELGGNDPFIVFDDADLENAVDCAFRGRIQNAGQTCCSPKRFIVQDTVKDAFVDGLLKRCASLKTGDPASPDTEMGSLISERAANEVQTQVEQTVALGAKLLCGGRAFNKTFFQPTVLDGITDAMPIAHDMEVFGPVFPVITFHTEEEAIHIANDTSYGLQAGVMTGNMNRAMRVASQLECGGVVINSSGNYRDVDQPFGGCKMSGLGREGISVTLQEYTQVKSYILKNILE